MLEIVRKIAALVLLLIIPLQGAAAVSLSVLQCAPPAGEIAQSSNGGDGASQERGDMGGNAMHDSFFCHKTVATIPVIPRTTAVPVLRIFVPSVSLLSSLFFPEQPHRPPFTS